MSIFYRLKSEGIRNLFIESTQQIVAIRAILPRLQEEPVRDLAYLRKLTKELQLIAQAAINAIRKDEKAGVNHLEKSLELFAALSESFSISRVNNINE